MNSVSIQLQPTALERIQFAVEQSGMTLCPRLRSCAENITKIILRHRQFQCVAYHFIAFHAETDSRLHQMRQMGRGFCDTRLPKSRPARTTPTRRARELPPHSEIEKGDGWGLHGSRRPLLRWHFDVLNQHAASIAVASLFCQSQHIN